MYRNYFYLNRSVLELNALLDNHRVRSIYSQEKERLIIECASGLEKRFFLEISVNPGTPFLTVKEDYRRARKNVTDLFGEALGETIDQFEIAADDRIIKLSLSSGEFYFMIRGKYTNFVLLKDSTLSFFKHNAEVSGEELLKELKSKEYTSAFNFPLISSGEPDEIRKTYPVISKDVIKEASSRINESTSFIISVQQTIIDFLEKRPALFTDINDNSVHLAPENFQIFSFTEKKVFDSYLPALSTYISKTFQLRSSAEIEKTIEHHLERELNKLTVRIVKLKERIEKGNRENEYRNKAELLMLNRSFLNKGMDLIEVQDIYSGSGQIKLKLDPKISPQKNIDAYFEKARNEKINYVKSLQLFNNAQKELERFLTIKNRFSEYKTKNELDAIMKELKIRGKEQQSVTEDLKTKFKQYIIDKEYYVYVGKDSKNNDLLTTRFAKQNDYWFHARSVSGSHVVLRNDKSKENIPKNILKKAASLAAYHSKAKTAGTVPVSYTFKKYVVKKKGMEPGKVALLKEEVLLVSPEIPEGAEYISNE